MNKEVATVKHMLGLAIAATLSISCSGSDDDSSTSSSGVNGSANPDSVANPDDVIETDPVATPAINSLNARNLAIDLLEVIDITRFLGADLPAAAGDFAAGEQTCAAAGTYTATTADNMISATFVDCQLADDIPAVLNGDMNVGIVSGDIAGDEYVLDITYGNTFSISNGQRRVSAEGQLGVTTTSVQRAISAAALLLNDSQGDFSVIMLNYTETAASADTVSLSIAYEVNLSRFGIEVVVATPDNLVGAGVTCPTAGAMTITAADGSVVSVQGAEGDNVLIGQQGNQDTVNCSEIATITGPAGQDTILVPPTAPGN